MAIFENVDRVLHVKDQRGFTQLTIGNNDMVTTYMYKADTEHGGTIYAVIVSAYNLKSNARTVTTMGVYHSEKACGEDFEHFAEYVTMPDIYDDYTYATYEFSSEANPVSGIEGFSVKNVELMEHESYTIAGW